MTDFSSLDSETRALALVGKFLQTWALMEQQLHEAIKTGLSLTVVQAAMVTANISLRDKINLVKTIIHVSIFQNPAEKPAFTKLLDAISTASSKRNMMAHDMFLAGDNGEGVRFFVVKAKGKLDFPDEIWSSERFKSEYENIEGFTEGLQTLVKRLGYAKLLGSLLLAQSRGQPIGLLAALSPPNDPSRPPLTLLGSDPQIATHPKEPKTAPEPQD